MSKREKQVLLQGKVFISNIQKLYKHPNYAEWRWMKNTGEKKTLKHTTELTFISFGLNWSF